MQQFLIGLNFSCANTLQEHRSFIEIDADVNMHLKTPPPHFMTPVPESTSLVADSVLSDHAGDGSNPTSWGEYDLIALDWPWFSSRTFRTQSEPNFEPGVQGLGSAEYPNPNLLVGLGLGRGQTWTSNNIVPGVSEKKYHEINCGKKWQCSPLPHFIQLPSNLPISTLDSPPSQPLPLPNHLIPMHTPTSICARMWCDSNVMTNYPLDGNPPPTSRHHWPTEPPCFDLCNWIPWSHPPPTPAASTPSPPQSPAAHLHPLNCPLPTPLRLGSSHQMTLVKEPWRHLSWTAIFARYEIYKCLRQTLSHFCYDVDSDGSLLCQQSSWHLQAGSQ